MSDTSLISAVVIAIVAYVYITIIRPARKDQAKHAKQIRNLKVGDTVLTTANFIARVTDIQILESGHSRVWLEIANGVIVAALPGAIIDLIDPAPAPKPAPTDQKGMSA
jgi:preprotein translocase YajC subunit